MNHSPDFLAGYKMAIEEATRMATGHVMNIPGGKHITDGSGRAWTAGNDYDLGRREAGHTIEEQGLLRFNELSRKCGD